jgi:adenine-specific DNA methylase
MIERDFDIALIAQMALSEKQIQQNYRPIIAVHKWFARRPGTLFRGLMLSEYAPAPLQQSFFESHNLRGLTIVDPFMGGGTPIVEANRIGCDVIGFDINPMANWIVNQEIEHIEVDEYRIAAEELRAALEGEIGHFYRTTCIVCGSDAAHVKYFLWVKTQVCRNCESNIDLFPGYVVAAKGRHPRYVVLCSICAALSEVDDLQEPGRCASCGENLVIGGPARRSTCMCPNCGDINPYPQPNDHPPNHKMIAIEYSCPHCKKGHKGRFFKAPSQDDLALFDAAEDAYSNLDAHFVPQDEIPEGVETDRLHRWGYKKYSETFNSRQLLGLELSCQLIDNQVNPRCRDALATNLSDIVRYQNMICRYDVRALKSLDVFSVHGFPVGLIQCESNLIGIRDIYTRTNIGSGGWSNMIDKFAKAKEYCDRPFEYVRNNGKKRKVVIEGEWIGDHRSRQQSPNDERRVDLSCKDATESDLAASTVDGIFTDPPYFQNVQYAELMDYCFVWLRQLVKQSNPEFDKQTTRDRGELTGNANMGRGFEHFTEGLSEVFTKMTHALKEGCPLVFTYHHNNLEAYYPIAVAIMDSGLQCTATLPCPAEMEGSIHISGTKSSIIDTVFVCRTIQQEVVQGIAGTPEGLARMVEADIDSLERGSISVTVGDAECIINGHLIRHAIWRLGDTWDKNMSTDGKLRTIEQWIADFGGSAQIMNGLSKKLHVKRSRKGSY